MNAQRRQSKIACKAVTTPRSLSRKHKRDVKREWIDKILGGEGRKTGKKQKNTRNKQRKMSPTPLKEMWTRRSQNTHVPDGHLTSVQSHVVAASCEFVGTFFFLWMAYSGQLMVGNQVAGVALAGGASSETVVLIAIVYGFSLLVNAWAFYRISGGLFNPAVSPLCPCVCVCVWALVWLPGPGCGGLVGGVRCYVEVETDHVLDAKKHKQVSLGLSLAGQLSWLRTAFLIPAQLLASMVAGGLVRAMFPGDIANVNTILAPGTSIAQGLFIEMFLTTELVFVILMLAAEKSKDTFLAPIGIGLALFVAELSGEFTLKEELNISAESASGTSCCACLLSDRLSPSPFLFQPPLPLPYSPKEEHRATRSLPFRLSYPRRVLYRRLAQPSPQLRMRGRGSKFPRVSLALLARSDSRGRAGRFVLPVR